MINLTYSAAFDDDVIEGIGPFTGSVPPTLAGGPLSRGSGTNFPGFDLVEWRLIQRNPALGMQAVRELVRARAEAASDPGGPWTAMAGTTATSVAQAAGRPGEFMNGGDFMRVRIPRQALVLNGDPDWPDPFLSFSFGFINEDRRGRLERRWLRATWPMAFDLSAPGILIAAPGGDRITTSPVRISGIVSDRDSSAEIQTVEVAIRDTERGEWFNFSNGSWGNSRSFSAADLELTNPQAGEFEYRWNEPPTGSQNYEATVRVLDRGSNQAQATRDFFVDRQSPIVRVTSPTLAVGERMPLEFTITDDSEIERVRLTIVDLETNLFWSGTTWQQARVEFNVPFQQTDDGATGSYDFVPPTGSTFYHMTIRVFDAAEREGRTMGNLRLIAVDVTDPVARIDFPAAGGTAPLGLITIRGTIQDDVAAGQVTLRIRDRVTDMQWNGGTWQNEPAFVSAQLGTIPPPSTTPTPVGWFYDWDTQAAASQGGSGDYRVIVFGTDAAGNEDEDRDGHNFTV